MPTIRHLILAVSFTLASAAHARGDLRRANHVIILMHGGMFSLFALATFMRIAVVASQLNKRPGISGLLPWTPIAAWLAASVLLSAAARRARSREPAPPPRGRIASRRAGGIVSDSISALLAALIQLSPMAEFKT